MSSPVQTVTIPSCFERELIARRLLDRAVEAALSGDETFDYLRWTQSAEAVMRGVDPESRVWNLLAMLQSRSGGSASAAELYSLHGAT